MIFRVLLLIITVVTGAFGAATAPVPAHADDFRPVFSMVAPDLPIMPGMTEDSDSSLLFDKPDGRIIETEAFGTAGTQIIEHFYQRALPALGWQPDGQTPRTYARNGEKLTYRISEDSRYNRIHISITPDES